MEVITEILGNVYQSHDWRKRLQQVDVFYACLDQWTAQKSRFVVVTDDGAEYPVALRRNTPINDGDILYYAPHQNRAVVVKLSLSEVMVIDLSALLTQSPLAMLRTAVEVGHALGNQHWPAVVKGTRIFVPLAVDKQVMRSVMDTHRFEGIRIHFYQGNEVIPYLAPHELRRLFGGMEEEAGSCGCGGKNDCGCEEDKDGCGCDDGKNACGCEDGKDGKDGEACGCKTQTAPKPCDCPPGQCTCGADSRAEKQEGCLCKVYEFKGFYTEYE
jgi:urease accessory protein